MLLASLSERNPLDLARYLLHEIFIHEAGRADGRPLTLAFKPCLVWMVRPTYQKLGPEASLKLQRACLIVSCLSGVVLLCLFEVCFILCHLILLGFQACLESQDSAICGGRRR